MNDKSDSNINFEASVLNPKPEWQGRLSLHELSADIALELSFQVARTMTYRTNSLHKLVKNAISTMVPVEAVTNRKLLKIFYGAATDRGSKRLIRYFRNSERTLKLDTAANYIQMLLYAREIEPFEGNRLWYLALLYHAAISTINEFFGHNQNNKSWFIYEKNRDSLRFRTCEFFERALEDSIKKSRKLPLEVSPINDVRQFMDFGTYEYYLEVSARRNPWESLHRTFELSSVINQYQFD